MSLPTLACLNQLRFFMGFLTGTMYGTKHLAISENYIVIAMRKDLRGKTKLDYTAFRYIDVVK